MDLKITLELATNSYRHSDFEAAVTQLDAYDAARREGVEEPLMPYGVGGDAFARELRRIVPNAGPNRSLFIVSVKYERGKRDRKWTVYRYVVCAIDEEDARRIVEPEYTARHRPAVLDVSTRRCEQPWIQRDIYQTSNGEPFSGRAPVAEDALFAEP